MQQSRNIPERGKTPATGNNSQRPNVQRAGGRPHNTPRPNGQSTGARPQTAPRPTAQRINGKAQSMPNIAAKPKSVTKTQAAPVRKPERKDTLKKEQPETIKRKKKKEPKDPNRVRILSLEGRVDIPMLIITLVLLAIGITMMFSASHAYSYRDNNGDSYAYVTKQMTAAVIGLVGMMLMTMFDYRFLRHESKHRHITVAHVFLLFTIVLILCAFSSALKRTAVRNGG